MKVGIVCPYDLLVPGGVQQLCIELAARLHVAGDEAILIGPGEPDRELDGANLVGSTVGVRANDSVAPITLRPGSWKRTQSAATGCDVLHIHEPMIPLTGWAALATDIPRVLTFHADAPRWVAPAYRAIPSLGKTIGSAVLTAVSPSAARALPARWGEVRTIPNAVDVDVYQVAEERRPNRIAFLGRDEPRKGLDIALEAFQLVRERLNNAELVVMGADRPGPHPPGVTFHGYVSGELKHRLLASSSIYVAPNIGGESFGIVLAEAMAAGCAIVASDLEPFREVVGEEAVLVPVGDIEGFAASISQLLDSPKERDRLRAAGKERVRRYDWSQILGRYQAAYGDAVASW